MRNDRVTKVLGVKTRVGIRAWLSLSAMVSFTLCTAHAQSPVDAELAVKRLWSPSEDGRQAARQEIGEIGAPAIPHLISLLEDIFKNPGLERFATGKEVDGAEALRQFEERTSDSPWDLTWRLESDACELLGHLRAVEAVPLLVQIMERGHVADKFASMSDAMRALVQIGREAVPKLVESLQMAQTRVNSTRFDNHEVTEEQKQYFVADIVDIRARVARVLGEIGDERALPVLEQAQHRFGEFDSWRPDIPYIEAAIRKIKDKRR